MFEFNTTRMAGKFDTPVPEDEFDYEFAKWYYQRKSFNDKQVGFVNGSVVYYKATIIKDKYESLSQDDQISIEDRWVNFTGD